VGIVVNSKLLLDAIIGLHVQASKNRLQGDAVRLYAAGVEWVTPDPMRHALDPNPSGSWKSAVAASEQGQLWQH
jgi:hypothetical protein